MRKGELLGRTFDVVVQIGSAHWLRSSAGKKRCSGQRVLVGRPVAHVAAETGDLSGARLQLAEPVPGARRGRPWLTNPRGPPAPGAKSSARSAVCGGASSGRRVTVARLCVPTSTVR
jgi:hypothetical protein